MIRLISVFQNELFKADKFHTVTLIQKPVIIMIINLFPNYFELNNY